MNQQPRNRKVKGLNDVAIGLLNKSSDPDMPMDWIHPFILLRRFLGKSEITTEQRL